MSKFVIDKVEGGYLFRLLSGAARVICTSVVYTKLVACVQAIENFRKGAKCVDDLTVTDSKVKICRGHRAAKKAAPHSKFEVISDAQGGFKFRFIAAYGQVIAASHRYLSKNDCLRGIAIVKESARWAPIETPNATC
ncbi:MAG: DUF1508 domain-containing protein [Candidatus Methanomethylophilus sp.]|nr:DUF1508 domain-containing protein [Methanomethylophilus sp.]MDD3233062.1 DUF1508 domain-containing protein [Methanomethylophilus sp.]MDD4222233.1 DUF1508 domain-containing protein [Methanomethylophilus sp.]MDD4668888.1 DUF1508 domain-containing protein [Methanomethylophilus sp.]